MTKLRVAVLSPWCHPWHGYGGLERHVFQLCRSLRREGIEVDLYTSRPWRAEDPLGSDDGFRLVVVPGVPALRRRFLVVATRNVLYPAFSLRMGHRVAAAAGPRGYAAVIAQGLTAFGVAFRTRSLGIRLPLVLNPQGMEEIVTPNAWKRAAYLPFRLLETYAARHAEHVVATDEALVETVEESLAVPAHKIVVIPNAIETEECLAHVTPEGRRRALESTGAAGASPLLVSVGRLAPNKGFDVALEALAALSAELPRSWRWVIAGDGPLRGALARRAAALGLLPHVVFAGALSDADLHNLLSAADLFLHPTLYEGSSLVTLEAMAHGLAIVATRAGGIPDKVLEGETGWLAEPGDAAALASAILRWRRATSEERRRIGEAGRRRCEERFHWRVAAGRYRRMIERLATA